MGVADHEKHHGASVADRINRALISIKGGLDA
jgi:hypothetical protein